MVLSENLQRGTYLLFERLELGYDNSQTTSDAEIFEDIISSFLFAHDPPAIRKRYGALAELFSYFLLAGRNLTRRCVRHAGCRQKKVLKPTCLGSR
jgi:hypothetical protein